MLAAPPGEKPQTAVLPGNTCQRASSQPSPAAATTVQPTPARNSGQSRTISTRVSTGMLCAIMQPITARSEEHTSELQSLMRISYAVFCLKKKKQTSTQIHIRNLTNIHNTTTET